MSEGGVVYVLEETWLALMRSLERRLAASSRRQYGMSSKEAGGILRRACDRAVNESVKAAMDAFQIDVGMPIDDWVVAEPIGSLYFPSRQLRVGLCTYARDVVPRQVARKKLRELAASRGLSAPIVYATVSARGSDAAQVLARERFVESAAVLDLIDRPKNALDSTALVRRADGTGGIYWSRGGWIIDAYWVDEKGRLADPYRRLSLALRRAEARQSDWERRVLAACRWFSKGWRSHWPADRLVSLTIALESLFVPGRQEPRKGMTIAREVTARFRMREFSEREQLEWFERLYRARNDAVHEGHDFLDEMEVERLADVAQFVIRRAAGHLVPAHRDEHRSCRDYGAAMRCSRWDRPIPHQAIGA